MTAHVLFTRTLYLPVFNPLAIPGYLFLHGIVRTSWFVWMFVQTLLIRSGRTTLHRRLGVTGAILAAIVPFAGLMATAGVVRRVVGSGIALDGDASALVGLGVSGPVVRFLSGVVWGNLTSAVSFAVLAEGTIKPSAARYRSARGSRVEEYASQFAGAIGLTPYNHSALFELQRLTSLVTSG